MHRHRKSVPILLLACLMLIFCVGANGQTLEEAMRENAVLKERLRLKVIEENKKLKVQIDGLKDGVPAAPATPSSTPTTTPTPTPTLSPSPSPSPTPATPADTVGSVCLQQDLNIAAYSRYDHQICDLADMLVKRFNVTNNLKLARTEVGESIATFFIAKLAGIEKATDPAARVDKDLRAFILDAENKRNDKQIGADSKSSGTTSLAVKGGIPRFLSWAMENGAATGTRSGNTLTFRINPASFASSVSQGTPFFESPSLKLFPGDDSFNNVLKKFSVGFSFDITRGTDPPTFIGSKQQLSAFSVRYNFINNRDPLSKKYVKDWELFRQNVVTPYAGVAGRQYDAIVCDYQSKPPCPTDKYRNDDLEKWATDTEAKLAAIRLAGKSNLAFEEEVRKVITESLASFPVEKLKTDAGLEQTLLGTGKALLDYNIDYKKLQDKIAKGTIVTLEYTNYREVNAPDVSNIRFIGEKGLGSDWSLTANASLSFLNKKPTAMSVKRIRDFDFTLQLEKPLMELSFGRPIFSFAGQYQRLPGNIIGPDGTFKMNTKGDTAVGQFKLTIPINGTGIKIPFSVTFANRSELIKESTVRANFGFTFDLDRLLLGRKLF